MYRSMIVTILKRNVVLKIRTRMQKDCYKNFISSHQRDYNYVQQCAKKLKIITNIIHSF